MCSIKCATLTNRLSFNDLCSIPTKSLHQTVNGVIKKGLAKMLQSLREIHTYPSCQMVDTYSFKAKYFLNSVTNTATM